MEINQKLNLKKDLLNFDFLKNPEIPLEENFLGGLGESKIQSLKKAISEIYEMIKSREKLSRRIHEEGESLKSEIERYLSENEKIQISSTDPLREKNDLRHKKIEISELQMNEKIGCWKDIALLKKELRLYEKELTEKEERIHALNKILGDESGL